MFNRLIFFFSFSSFLFLGRGDWSQPEQFKAGLQAVDLLGAYFAKVADASDSKL